MRSEWILRAECAKPHMRPAWWDIMGTKLTPANKLAIQVCGKCPVRDECHGEAEEEPYLSHGTIRGGRPRLPLRGA